jgi:hypothetical protein
VTVNQEGVLDLVDEIVLKDDVGKGYPAAPGFPAPPDTTPREAVFQRLI